METKRMRSTWTMPASSTVHPRPSQQTRLHREGVLPLVVLTGLTTSSVATAGGAGAAEQKRGTDQWMDNGSTRLRG
jgi:hypothetical protein